MSVQTLELKPAVSFAAVVKRVKAPLAVPAWSIAVLVVMAGVYGYVSGRQNPIHHYVPYVGYPLVMDTTTGKACYAATPKASEDAAAVNASFTADSLAAPSAPTGPSIPMCGK